jgi:transcription-repair coupling factor (superfamily II helicase)
VGSADEAEPQDPNTLQPQATSDLPFDLADPLQAPVQLDLPFDARIPATYIEDEEIRLQLYRRIAGITHTEMLDEMRKELVDRFGKDEETGGVPEEVENLLFQIRIKILATRAGVSKVGRELDHLVLHADALENMDRRTLQRRLRLHLGKLNEEDGTHIPDEGAKVARRAIHLPIDDEGQWQHALVRTLQVMEIG